MRMGALCAGVALMNGAMAVTSATSTVVTGDHLGTTWAALPNTVAIVGTGVGAILLTRTAMRLSLSYLAAALGALLAVWAVTRHDVILLTAAMALLGLGNAGAQLSRYTAADLYPAGRKGRAIGLVVWAAAAGAVGGPLLLGLFSSTAAPFLLSAVACLVAVGTARRFRTAPAVRTRVRARPAMEALLPMVTAQVVMVAVMTATPMHMHLHGSSLASVGLALSAHTLGMFALAPLTGRLTDRFGPRPVIRAGLVLLATACILTAAGAGMVALFLLGYAWNLCFVAGSNLLTTLAPEEARAQVEGTADAVIWTTAAAASLISTPLLAYTGYETLALIAAATTLLPLARRQISQGA